VNSINAIWGLAEFASIIEMGPDPTHAYFWPAVNKRLTCLWPGYFSTWPKEIFFDLKEKIEKFYILEEIFQIQTQTINGWPNQTRPEPQKIDPTRVKNFWPGPITIVL